MKRVFALLLVIAILFSFSACTNNDADIRGEQSTNSPSTSETQSTNGSSEEETTTPSTEEFSLGSSNGLTYENKFIGIGCTLESGWTFYTDEQIKELNNLATDLAGEEYQEAIKNSTVIYDMYAVSDDQMSNMNVNLEKVNPLTLAVLDIETNYETAYSTLKQAFENVGYTDVTYEIGSVEIAGTEHKCLNISAQISGIAMYETIISIKCNGYLANITVTTLNENTIDSILANFYAVE